MQKRELGCNSLLVSAIGPGGMGLSYVQASRLCFH